MANDVLKTGFSHNWRNGIEIDTAGNLDPAQATDATFVTLAAFMTGITPTPGDVVENANYWADKDNSHSDVTGHARTWAITGNVLQGDPACDFIQGLEDKEATGDDVKTLARFTKANGVVKVYQVTVQNIVTIGGNGNAKSTLTFTLAANGMPVTSTVDETDAAPAGK